MVLLIRGFMSLKILVILIVVLSVVLFQNSSLCQSFGFGCLGFVGGYGGYSYQKFNAPGLNNYVKDFNETYKGSLSSPMGNFDTETGYRVGINFFRANIRGFILTTKGFYQSLTQKNSATINYFTANRNDSNSNAIFELDLKSYGLGLDLGTSITNALSWKVVDAALLYNMATFTDTRNYPGAATEVFNYNNEKYILGYTVGTGFILEIIDQYISLEGVAGYTAFAIDRMKSANGPMPLTENSPQPMSNFIESGGFNAVVQLNIGFPL
jgi:hypothetical protein